MNEFYSGDCPNLSVGQASAAHENRFYDKVKKSKNLKNKAKTQNSKKTEGTES